MKKISIIMVSELGLQSGLKKRESKYLEHLVYCVVPISFIFQYIWVLSSCWKTVLCPKVRLD